MTYDLIDRLTGRSVGYAAGAAAALESAASYQRLTGREAAVVPGLAGAPYDPAEAAACCGYPIGEHRQGEPCPTEIDIARRWGYM